MLRKMVRIVAILVMLAAVIGTAAASNATAAPNDPNAPNAPIIFSEPNGQNDFAAEGEEFFTTAFADPADMSNGEDVVLETGNNWNPAFPQVSGGTWQATSAIDQASLFLLHPGFDNVNWGLKGRSGKVAQINSTTYQRLVIKYRTSAATNMTVTWMPEGTPNQAPIGNSNIYQVPAGENILDIDLTATGGGASPTTWTSRPSWGGLRIEPARFTAGVQVTIDWVRLVPASGGPTLNTQWSCSNCAGQVFDIYADTDTNAGNGGMVRLASGVSATATSFAVPVGKLAGGTYYLVAISTGAAPTYSGQFTVLPAPILQVTAPSSTSGEDFATTVLGNPWDMNDAADVDRTLNVSNFTVGNGTARGTGTNGDPQVFLLDNASSIDTTRFKYLTFSLTMPRPGNAVFNIVRGLWSGGGQGATEDIINWHDYTHRYTFDLSNQPTSSGSWSGTVSTLRIDPHEDPVPANFTLGPVLLTADPRAAQNSTTQIRWNVVQGSGTVSLFRDASRNFSGTEIASGIAASAGQYDWNVGSTPAGTYWLRVVVSDGFNTRQWYGDAPLIITAGGGGPTATPTTPTGQFTDVSPTDFFYEPVRYLAQRGVISGYDDPARCPTGVPCFLPFASTTRSQMAKIIVGAEGWKLVNPTTPSFNDVPTSNPFYQFVETAVARGIVSGYNDGSFRPFANVTRGQLSKIVVLAEGWPLENPTTPTFSDVTSSNPFYREIETAVEFGIISGYNDNTFRWGNNATRGQIAKIVHGAVTAP